MHPNTHAVELTHPASSSTSSLPNCPTVHHSPEKSTITVDAEKQVNPWDSYEEDEMPEETQPHLAFSIYRRLFSVAVLTNMGIFISYAIRSYEIALVVVANIFFAILMRQGRVINSIACSVPQSLLRECIIMEATIRELLLFEGHFCRYFGHPSDQGTCSQQTGSNAMMYSVHGVDGNCIGVVAGAFVPHSAIYVVVLTNDYKGDKSLGHALVHSAPWLTMVLSWSMILPWTKLQKVPARSGVLSNRAVHLFFDYYGRPHPVPGSFQWFSTDPLNEWHSFATIAAPGVTGYLIIMSEAALLDGAEYVNNIRDLLVDDILAIWWMNTSQNKLTEKKVIYGLRNRGILAFRAVFDS
ncbi:uncharacterized protein BT62DRAFT_915560 [Guyanagaster necrorhizus]|uniref:Uncharacterized protein n=1 Tax=Guyanagaster necrorhizus TaxID=856835 RepID=A0A9P8AXY5_9AGAR|nr:uncharacterized protein BT62DRAFT_915560 [Guyanagaster necrorhizus MCA 3950]KAG7451701.1 hypothetical protein BT62DRAFT_915560 [Guyanagaster necrorhizus MCA 3950]